MAKNLEVNDRSVRIQIWDTAGQEAFRSITRSYYKNSTCAFLVYDITSKESFKNLSSWLEECKEMCYKDILICLVGNKTDLSDKRVVSTQDGKNFAEQNGLLFFETSAKDGSNIEELFQKATVEIVTKLEGGKLQMNTANGIKIGKFPNKEIENSLSNNKKRGCCS